MRTRYLAAVLVPVVLAAALAWAQSVGRPTRVGASSGPMWSRGFNTDGGVTSASIQSDTATVGSLDAGEVRANTAAFGAMDAGTAVVSGKTTTGSLEVVGETTFRQRPTGIFLPGTLTRAAALSLGVGCSTLGTVSVPGTRPPDACVVSAIPTAALSLGVTYDCYVTTPGSATIRACGFVALVAAPAGEYRVVAIGPP